MNIKELQKEILEREFRKQGERKIMLCLQIALQKELNPEEKSAKKPLRFAQNGQPISWEEITRKEHIQMLEKELEGVNLILEVIKNLNK